MRAGASGSQTDSINLYFPDETTNGIVDAAWYGLFGDRAGLGTGLITSDEWTPGMDATFTVDLSALSLDGGGTVDLIAELKAPGFLDEYVEDESAADYFILTLVVTALLLASGLAALAVRRRRSL